MTAATHKRLALALQGGGPEGDRIAGAALAFVAFCARHGITVAGVSGSSVGAIVAVLIAFGFSAERILGLLVHYLQHNRMLDPSAKAAARFRLLDWSRIPDLVEKEIGPRATLGQARIPLVICVSSLDTGEPLYLTSWTHPNVLVSEALRAASAVHPRITGAHTIPSLGTKMSPDIRRFVDSGWSDNTVDGVFDDDCARVAIRLNNDATRVRSVWQGGGLLDDDLAAFRCALNAASRPKTRRRDGLDIVLARGAGWDFSKTPEQVRQSWADGGQAAWQALSGWYGVEP